MDTPRLTTRRRIARIIELLALALALGATFVAGSWIGPLTDPRHKLPKPPDSSSQKGPIVPATSYDPMKGFPRPNSRAPEDPRKPEQRAIQARRSILQRDASALENECQLAAAGDWQKWQQKTAPFRTALKAKIDALKDIPEAGSAPPAYRYAALEGRDGFPLFEIGSRSSLKYLYDPAEADEFVKRHIVVDANRWLKEHDIDLIFVPVPTMTEVYIDRFLEPCPADAIIAPHLRRTLLDLLKQDVEVIDLFTLFRTFRDTDSEYLYNPADSQLAPRGMRVLAKQIAARIERYAFGMRARYSLPIVQSFPGPYRIDDLAARTGSDLTRAVLTPEQQERAHAAQAKKITEVQMQDGKLPSDDAASPVILIGHRYEPQFPEQVLKELNLLVHSRLDASQTTEALADFARQPDLLKHARVVVWIASESSLAEFKPFLEPSGK